MRRARGWNLVRVFLAMAVLALGTMTRTMCSTGPTRLCTSPRTPAATRCLLQDVMSDSVPHQGIELIDNFRPVRVVLEALFEEM